MKVQSLFVVLIFKFVTGNESAKVKSLAVPAISSILVEYFGKNSQKVDLINFGKVKRENEKIFDKILRHKDDSVTFKVLCDAAENSWGLKLNTSSILTFDSPQNFMEMKNRIEWVSNKKIRYKSLIYILNTTIDDLAGITDGFPFDNVNFLLNETNKSIDLVASFMFTPSGCRTNQFKTINRFVRNGMRWESSNFYPEKYQNFHECPLVVGVSSPERYSEQFIIESLAKSFNFDIEVQHFIVQHSLNPADFAAFDLIEQISPEQKNFVISATYKFQSYTVACPPGELYTQLEKMFIMFDADLWVAIIVTLTMSLVIIQVLNLMSMKIQIFVYGRNIGTPTLNFVSILLTGGQFKVPGRNFARFLLILFIIWSLIFRTCYQSKQFEFMQADMRKAGVTSFAEFLDSDLTIYAIDISFFRYLHYEGRE